MSILEASIVIVSSYASGIISAWYFSRGTCAACKFRRAISRFGLPMIEWLYGRWPGIADKAIMTFFVVQLIPTIREVKKYAGTRTQEAIMSRVRQGIH
jgi:hypothetical protein